MDASKKMAAQTLSTVCIATEADEFLDFEVISPLSCYKTVGQLYPVEKLVAGCSIVIEGRVKDKCSSFSIDLRCGEDIALHINPRFDQNYIARNAKINRHWGVEESQLLQTSPFIIGEPFVLEILVAPTEYMVAVNGVHLFSFSHRLIYSDVGVVEISRSVVVNNFIFAQATIYPSVQATLVDLPVKRKMKCPVFAKIQCLNVGDLVEVTGRVHSLPHSFYINLQAGIHSMPHPIIAYHIAARYIPSWQVIQNSWSSGRWNEELSEKLPAPLFPGETFQLLISCLPNGFSCSISGKTLKILPYRVPLSSPNFLVIQGDVSISSINSTCLQQTTAT